MTDSKLSDYYRGLGKLGGKARAKKLSKAELSKIGVLGAEGLKKAILLGTANRSKKALPDANGMASGRG